MTIQRLPTAMLMRGLVVSAGEAERPGRAADRGTAGRGVKGTADSYSTERRAGGGGEGSQEGDAAGGGRERPQEGLKTAPHARLYAYRIPGCVVCTGSGESFCV